MQIYRAFFNQPSTLQPLHALHGQRCIVHDTGGDDVTLYFTDGPVHSMTALRQCVSRIYLCSLQKG
jgi:hypothetical protein